MTTENQNHDEKPTSESDATASAGAPEQDPSPTAEPIKPEAETAEAAPKPTKAAAKATKATPKATKASAKATKATPKASEATPKATQAAPKASEAAPKATKATPKASEATPKATQAAAKASEPIPEATKATPEPREAKPKASEADATIAKAAPERAEAVPTAAAAETTPIEVPTEAAPSATTAEEAAEGAPAADAPVVMQEEGTGPPKAAAATTDTTAEDAEAEAAKANAMAEALAAQDARLGMRLKTGQRVEVKLVQVGDKDSFLDFGGRAEGSIATAELKNEKGEMRVEAGAAFTAIVKKIGDGVEFTVGRGKGADLLKMRELEQAQESGLPIQGKIKSTNKGGFEVQLAGVRAFCPFSQIDVAYCDRPEDFVGQSLPFQIIAFERGGRNIVLSRRKLLEAEAKEQAHKIRDDLEVGQVFDGRVRRIQPYGAFVDIGGIDGLVHVSEVSRGHVNDPKQVLKVGQAVKVKVIRLEGLGTDKERISLSMKELEDDPWDGIEERFKPGTTVEGTVVRLTDFGAFVELEPGLDGLVHISEIANERIGHPKDVLAPGQSVQVRVLKLEAQTRRISLSLRDEAAASERPPRRGGGGRPSRDRSELSHYVAAPEEPKREKTPDVSNMEYDDALELLKQKFNRE